MLPFLCEYGIALSWLRINDHIGASQSDAAAIIFIDNKANSLKLPFHAKIRPSPETIGKLIKIMA
jgi:hypothetical protein